MAPSCHFRNCRPPVGKGPPSWGRTTVHAGYVDAWGRFRAGSRWPRPSKQPRGRAQLTVSLSAFRTASATATRSPTSLHTDLGEGVPRPPGRRSARARAAGARCRCCCAAGRRPPVARARAPSSRHARTGSRLAARSGSRRGRRGSGRCGAPPRRGRSRSHASASTSSSSRPSTYFIRWRSRLFFEPPAPRRRQPGQHPDREAVRLVDEQSQPAGARAGPRRRWHRPRGRVRTQNRPWTEQSR